MCELIALVTHRVDWPVEGISHNTPGNNAKCVMAGDKRSRMWKTQCIRILGFFLQNSLDWEQNTGIMVQL